MAVAEQLSFRRAADFLGLTPSALSHTIRGLESTLGTRLLQRTTRSVALTDSGAQLIQRITPLLQELDVALQECSDEVGRVTGTLRVNGSIGAIDLLLKNVVPIFLTKHPEAQLDLVSDGVLVDIVDKGFDAGIRLAEAVPKDMVAVPLSARVRFVAVASPAYLAARSAPKVPDDLKGHQCIRQRLPSGKRYRWEFKKRHQEIAFDVPGALTMDNNQLMVNAACLGLGIAYVPEHEVRPAIAQGKLLMLLEDWCPPISGLHIYFPAQRHMRPILRAFIDAVKTHGLENPSLTLAKSE